MKACKVLVCCLLCLFFLNSCGIRGSEPEQIYLVSAIGFDGGEEGIRLSLEVPITRESETEGMETKLFTGEGKTVEEAMRRITVGLSRELSFTHCALMVLGDSLSKEQADEAFAFAANGAYLPIAAQVVSAENAEALLKGGSLSAPAAGYDIPSVIREVEELFGVETHSLVYELWMRADAGHPTVLPRFSPAGEEDPRSTVFEGIAILQRERPAVYLSVEESTPYALLADSFRGTNGKAGGYGKTELRVLRQRLDAAWENDRLSFTLHLHVRTAKGATQQELEAMEKEVKQSMESLFEHLKERAGADVLAFRERSEHIPKEWSEEAYTVRFLSASLEVICHMEGEEQA